MKSKIIEGKQNIAILLTPLYQEGVRRPECERGCVVLNIYDRINLKSEYYIHNNRYPVTYQI